MRKKPKFSGNHIPIIPKHDGGLLYQNITPRMLEVFTLACMNGVKETARYLGISYQTAKGYNSELYHLLLLNEGTQIRAMIILLRRGTVKLEDFVYTQRTLEHRNRSFLERSKFSHSTSYYYRRAKLIRNPVLANAGGR